MARPQTVGEDELIAQLAGVFSSVGYVGASLSQLSDATGLQRASLYHRFPGGKHQMAQEVLSAASSWLAEKVIAPLTRDGEPEARLREATVNLNDFYRGGTRACLLNMLSSPRIEDGPFSQGIRSALMSLIDAFATLARDAGHSPDGAQRQAERAVMLLQGSLVLSRGLGSGEPFVQCLSDLSADLIDRKSGVN